MPSKRSPRLGSMQVWPRKRAKRIYPRVRSWSNMIKGASFLGFAGFKVGMTHILARDIRKTSLTKNEDVFVPVTVVECPPLKVVSIRFYKKENYVLSVSNEILCSNSKDLRKKLPLPKKLSNIKSKLEELGKKLSDFEDIAVTVHTQPKLTSIGSKKPSVFEVALSGTLQEKFDFIVSNFEKEIYVTDLFKEGDLVDIHAVTKGKGFQGPVKRFGVAIRHHKSEKTKRGPGSLGGWKGHGHFMYRIAHAGQMGFHTRVDYNKQIFKIGTKPESIKVKGGFLRYGFVKNQYLLIKGSVPGASKRLIRINKAIRPNLKKHNFAYEINYVSLESKQGR